MAPPFAGAAVVALLFAGLLGRFVFAGGGDGGAPPARGAAAVGSSATAAVTRAQAALRTNPADPTALTELGLGYLTRARETADPSYYPKAAAALRRAAQLRPDQLRTLVGIGLLHLARHEFRSALAVGLRAHRRYPDSADALGVVVDAYVDLGRYREGATAVQRMVNKRPNLASYARVSYIRELLGDPAGALVAMMQAAVAGSGSPQDLAYVQALLGDLHWQQGRLTAATLAYTDALRSVPAYGAAEFGLARVEAARGDLRAASTRLAALAARLPLPETVALAGDVHAALGEAEQAGQQYALVRGIERLQRAAGVVVDLEAARFAADHARDPGGRPQTAVSLARAAYAARPTIYAADVLGWALRQAGRPAEALGWADRALRFGTRDAALYWHRAATAADLGRTAQARRDLATAYAINPVWSLRDAPAARALAARLHLAVPTVSR